MMIDYNMVIASNIVKILKQQNKKQIDLASALNTNKQTVSKMLNGTRVISAFELKCIAEFLGVKMERLTHIDGIVEDTDIACAFMGKVNSAEAKKALMLADALSDMILFHKRVRENGETMMEEWD